MELTTPVLLIAGAALLLIGWIACKAQMARKQSEKAIALQLGIKAVGMLGKLQSPNAIADATAAKAREDALLQQFKDAVTELK